jgi:ABC-type antimicrobial peptide transport system permease subunit
MQILSGHDFSSSSWLQDTGKVLINETAVQRMGLKKPLGQKIKWNGGPDAGVEIIGVVKDALMDSPFTPVEATIFSHGSLGNVAVYDLKANANIQSAIKKIGQIFDKYNPAYPFSYRFADNAYAEKFNLEVLVGKLAGVFATLAIFISCLGLFGLAAYIAEQRTKEIGIRKVLGATIFSLWQLLSKDFVSLVIISLLIAAPVSYFFMHQWLQTYPYHTGITWWIFVVTAAGALVVTLATVSYQSIKAAILNPVKSLRSE